MQGSHIIRVIDEEQTQKLKRELHSNQSDTNINYCFHNDFLFQLSFFVQNSKMSRSFNNLPAYRLFIPEPFCFVAFVCCIKSKFDCDD